MTQANPNRSVGCLPSDLSNISFSSSFEAVARSTELVTTVTCGLTASISDRVLSSPEADRASRTTTEPGLNLRAVSMAILAPMPRDAPVTRKYVTCSRLTAVVGAVGAGVVVTEDMIGNAFTGLDLYGRAICPSPEDDYLAVLAGLAVGARG
uniref:Uncharacterized protein n=1 Tax=Anopheles christyi TaxID=43041 RepID=A0A182KHZ7_9DIPT